MATVEIHACRVGEFTLRYIKSPRFEGDLPWWIAEDLMGSIAALVGRAGLAETLVGKLLDDCPAEDRVTLGVVEDGGGGACTAVSEFQLVGMIAGLSATDLPSLRRFADHFEAASAEASTALDSDLEAACARRGLDLDDDGPRAANDR